MNTRCWCYPKHTWLLLAAALSFLCGSRLSAQIMLNIGNLHLKAGAFSERVLLDSWIEAKHWLNYSAALVDEAENSRLAKRIERIDAYLGKYGQTRVPSGPENPAHSPEYLVNSTVGNQYLIGFDLDEEALELHDIIIMKLHWLQEDKTAMIAQQVFADNAVINGGFEQTITVGEDAPLGFALERYSFYSRPFDHRNTVIKTRHNVPTICAELDNRRGTSPTGYVSAAFIHRPDTSYLVSAWLWEDEDLGKANFGLLNLSPDISEDKRNEYVSPVSRDDQWTLYAGMISPSNDTSRLRAEVTYWGTGKICIDNILVVALENKYGE